MALQKTGSSSKKSKERIVENVTASTSLDISGGEKLNAHKREPSPIINIIQTETNQPKIANWISGISAAISIGLGIITLFLFLQTKKQADSSVDAAKIARETIDSTKSYNKQDANRRKQEEQKSDRAEKEKFKRDTAAFNLQIKALNQTQTNFNALNKAFLQVSNFNVLLTTNTIVSVSFSIYDIGAQPAKATEGSVGFLDTIPSITDPSKIFGTKKPTLEKDNTYITIYAPQPKTIILNTPMDTTGINMLKNGIHSAYIYGKYRYLNMATNKKTLYNFVIEINMKNGMNYRFIQNDNIPIK